MADASRPVSLEGILGAKLFNQLREVGAFDLKPFKPAAIYFAHLDILYIVERDSTTVSEYVQGSNIELLRDGSDQKQLVGVAIHCFSQMVPKEVIDVMISSDVALMRLTTANEGA
jgi:hypothetical protein